MTNPDLDPFAGSTSAPSLSFKDAAVGTVRTITVTEGAKLVQSRDFNTGEPAFWPAKPGETPNPKMSAVINGTDEEGEEVSVWAQKPSSMFAAIADAQKAVKPGYRLKPGDTLAIKLTGEKPNPDKKKHPQKLYAAKITPAPEADAFGDDAGQPPF